MAWYLLHISNKFNLSIEDNSLDLNALYIWLQKTQPSIQDLSLKSRHNRFEGALCSVSGTHELQGPSTTVVLLPLKLAGRNVATTLHAPFDLCKVQGYRAPRLVKVQGLLRNTNSVHGHMKADLT